MKIVHLLFQSTHPCGMRLRRWNFNSIQAQNFNPRIPAGCDRNFSDAFAAHSDFNPRIPAGCDPGRWWRLPPDRRISIHASLRDATINKTRTIRLSLRDFNPRIPAGCDYLGPNHRGLRRKISIHASLRDATQSVLSSPSSPIEFQSTHPCGMRRFARLWCWYESNFNPRIPAGCDLI
mgnify:CR=1 FL=1